jgi:hypothetical protein
MELFSMRFLGGTHVKHEKIGVIQSLSTWSGGRLVGRLPSWL